MGVQVTSGPIPVEDTFTFEAIEAGTRVTRVIEGEPGGFFRLGEPIVARMIRRQFENNLHNLKDLLEAQAEG